MPGFLVTEEKLGTIREDGHRVFPKQYITGATFHRRDRGFTVMEVTGTDKQRRFIVLPPGMGNCLLDWGSKPASKPKPETKPVDED